MKTTKLIAALSVIAVLTFFVSFAAPDVTFAHAPSKSHVSTVEKIIVTNLAPGQIVSTNIDGLVGAHPAPPQGGYVEMFAPIGQTTNVYLWDATKGYTLLDTVVATANEPDIVLSALSPQVQTAQGSGFANSGMASQMSSQSSSGPTISGAPDNCGTFADASNGRDRCRRDSTGKKLDQ